MTRIIRKKYGPKETLILVYFTQCLEVHFGPPLFKNFSCILILKSNEMKESIGYTAQTMNACYNAQKAFHYKK